MKKKTIIVIFLLLVVTATIYFTIGRFTQTIIIDGTTVESMTRDVYFGSKVRFDEELKDKMYVFGRFGENGVYKEDYEFYFYVNGEKIDDIDNYRVTSDIEINLVPKVTYEYRTENGEYEALIDINDLDNIILPDNGDRKFCGWSGPEPVYNGYYYKYINRQIICSYVYDPKYETQATFVLDGEVIDTCMTSGKVTPPNLGDDYVVFGWIKEDENDGEMYTTPQHSDGYVYFGMNRTYNYFDFENREINEDTTFIANAVKCTKIQLETEGQTSQGYWRDITNSVTVKVGNKLDFAGNTYLHIMPADLKVEISCYGHYSNCKFYVADESLVEYDEEGYMVMKNVGTTTLTIDFGGVTTKVKLNIVENYGWEGEPAYGWVD